MSIKQFDDGVGTLTIFFDNNPSAATFKGFIKGGFFRVKLVFFGEPNEESLSVIKNNKDYLDSITYKQLHFVSNKPQKAEEISNALKKHFQIESISVPVSEFFNYLAQDNYNLGLEKWDEGFGSPHGIENVEDQLCSIVSNKKLIPYVENIINDLQNLNVKTDIEKIVYIDLWIQKNIQYIVGRESKRTVNGKKEVYICESISDEARVDDVLINHFGRCQDIAFSVALILNHPKIGIKCRQVANSSKDINHSWNIVTINGADYIMDFTRNITRNPNQVSGALKAFAYSPMFTLLGKDEVESYYTQNKVYDTHNISNESVDRGLIFEAVEKFKARGVETNWGDFLVVDSYLKED